MADELLIWTTLALPAAAAGACALAPTVGLAWAFTGIGACSAVLLDALVVTMVVRAGTLVSASGWWRVDALSAVHLALLALVYVLSTVFALIYFRDEDRRGHVTLKQARTFAGLWCGSLAALTLLLVSNNVGIMWVGMETTTLLTAFLISLHVSRASLEAMWKYVLICSVAIAFAFMGTLLVAAAAPHAESPTALLWTSLLADAARLDPRLMRAAFVFLVVGYGTKAGLAPMHNWLPDAHSQAPAPVSALFSGFMLNAALYCVLRFLPIVDGVPGCQGWPQGLLLGFGLLSVIVGAGFILFQHDAKRLLAYCSVEHLGLIALGAGVGYAGTVAALFHSFNHSLAKSLAFFAAGRLGQTAGGHEIKRLSGAMRTSPLWGTAWLAACLALMGAAPFATFVTELAVLRAIFNQGSHLVLLTVLAGLGLAFVGLLRHGLRVAWARPEEPCPPLVSGRTEWVLVALPIVALLLATVWLPAPIAELLNAAARIVAGPQAGRP